MQSPVAPHLERSPFEGELACLEIFSEGDPDGGVMAPPGAGREVGIVRGRLEVGGGVMGAEVNGPEEAEVAETTGSWRDFLKLAMTSSFMRPPRASMPGAGGKRPPGRPRAAEAEKGVPAL